MHKPTIITLTAVVCLATSLFAASPAMAKKTAKPSQPAPAAAPATTATDVIVVQTTVTPTPTTAAPAPTTTVAVSPAPTCSAPFRRMGVDYVNCTNGTTTCTVPFRRMSDGTDPCGATDAVTAPTTTTPTGDTSWAGWVF